jgi:tetratricopeptide (TPR) repeat protein
MRRLSVWFELLLLLASCAQSKEKQAYKLFNEGVACSLQAMEKQNAEQAVELEKQAIAKYLQTLKVDSTHRMVRATLGHSYYVLNDFSTAIKWFEASNKVDTASVASYRELGICRLGTGDIEGGWADLRTAFRLDSVNGPAKLTETKTITVDDLSSLGQQVFSYGEGYAAQGEPEKGRDYREAGVNILLVGYSIQSTRKDVARLIAEDAKKLHNEPLRVKYTQLAQ